MRCWCWRSQSSRSRSRRFPEPFLLFVEVFSDQIGRVHLLHHWSWTQGFFRFPTCFL